MEKWERVELLKCLARTIIRRYGVAVSLEYRFHATRKWRFDLAMPDLKFFLEVDGGGWVQGRHNRPIGKMKDDEKFNEAAILGWRGLTVTWAQVSNGEAEALLDRALGGK